MKLDPIKLAESEIAWWEKYHTRDWKGLEEAIKEKRKEEFGVEINDITATEFVRACEEYIHYKKALAEGNKESAEGYLNSAQGYMIRHYKKISEMIK